MHGESGISDDELDELEQQYEDLDPKLIQIQILMELKAIRAKLNSPEPRGESETVECSMCDKEIPEGQKEDHAETHNTPPDMMDDLYS